MELFDHLSLGLSVAFIPYNLMYCFLGALLGTVIGVLPGIGPLATISVLLPLTAGLPAETSLIMLAGIYYGAQYGGSTTAILLNLPGEVSSTITTLEGYKMAQNGRAGPALAAAALSSFTAGTLATLLIAIVAIPLSTLALEFGPAEYFSLLTVGLVSSVALASGSVIKAIGMICLGLLLGLTGIDIYTGSPRFVFGSVEFYDGLDFVAIAVGMFGIGEILRNLESKETGSGVIARIGSIMPTMADLRRIAAPTLRGSAIGSLLGVLPGGGALLASMVSYNVEKKVSRNSAEFGHGAIEGVAAPEAANNAAAQTSFIPMLSLGIPSGLIMAVMIGAMIMQGIQPGPSVVTKNPELFWGLIASMWIGNAMLLVLNLPLVGIWVRLLSMPYWILYPAIVVFCCVGVFSVENSTFAVYGIAVAGLVGYALVKLECELAPFIMGFVLGPMLEEHLRRAMVMSSGDPMIFVATPISAGFLLIAVVTLIVISRPAVANKRKEVFVED